MKPTEYNILLMLKESNAIEDEWDAQSLLDAKEAWDYLMEHRRLTPGVIGGTHYKLMQNKPIEEKYKGGWRDVPVYIGDKRLAQPKPVIDSLMQDFCADMNNPDFNDVLSMHIRFENIHPFIDGNGRIGRMLMNWHSLQLGQWLVIYKESEKHTKYYPMFDPGNVRRSCDVGESK